MKFEFLKWEVEGNLELEIECATLGAEAWRAINGVGGDISSCFAFSLSLPPFAISEMFLALALIG